MSEILTFDEMNRLGMKRKSMEYAEYFGDMELTGDQVRERISFSEETDDELLLILTMLSLMNTYAVSEDEWIATTKQTLIADYTGIVEGYTPIDDYLRGYISDFSENFILTTIENPENMWFMSEDRAMYDSENEANTVLNYKEYIGAISGGYTQKEWRTFRDNRVRKTHKAVDGRTIPIKAYFSVGNSLMRFPKDQELASNHPEELINCRCTLKFHK